MACPQSVLSSEFFCTFFYLFFGFQSIKKYKKWIMRNGKNKIGIKRSIDKVLSALDGGKMMQDLHII